MTTERQQPSIRRPVTAATLLVTIAAAGCASSPPKYDDLKAFVQAHNHDVSASIYRIKPPDVIAISSPGSPEIDGVMQRVANDGTITLKLLDAVKVSALTPKEVAAKLESLLTRYYVDPGVEVRVVAHESQRIYVFGQVAGQGPKPFTGRDTVLDVLAESRPNFIAWGSKVRVIRPSATPDEVHEITVDVDRMMETGDLRDNLLLQEGDIVYVPPTPLGSVGLAIQEVLFPFSPLMSAYSFPADVAATTNVYSNLGEQSGARGFYPGPIGNYGEQGW